MKFVRENVIDLLVTLLVLLLAYGRWEALYYGLLGYTALILLLKVVAVFAGSFGGFKSRNETPDWVYHLLYGINVAASLFSGFTILAIGWVAVWLLSVAALYRGRSTTNRKAAK